MLYLSTGNEKYLGLGIKVRTFGLPAVSTCPGAGACKLGCYAQQGRYGCTNVREAQLRRLELTRDLPRFKETIAAELRQFTPDLIRIHDAGDFYNEPYLKAWLDVIKRAPKVKFLAYTKMVPMVKQHVIPENMAVVFSEGGRWDGLIDQARDKFSRVFPDQGALLQAGFIDCHETDLPALEPGNRLIGLVYHGAKSRAWRTTP